MKERGGSSSRKTAIFPFVFSGAASACSSRKTAIFPRVLAAGAAGSWASVWSRKTAILRAGFLESGASEGSAPSESRKTASLPLPGFVEELANHIVHVVLVGGQVPGMVSRNRDRSEVTPCGLTRDADNVQLLVDIGVWMD